MGMEKPEFGFGVHLMLDGYGCDRSKLEDLSLIASFLDEYPAKIDMTKIMPPYVSATMGWYQKTGAFPVLC